MWAGYERLKKSCYGVTTTNHLESHHRLLKKDLHAGRTLSFYVWVRTKHILCFLGLPLAKCFSIVLEVYRRKRIHRKQEHVLAQVSRFNNIEDHPYYFQLFDCATSYACDLLRKEIKLSATVDEKECFEVDLEDGKAHCTCHAFNLYSIPCRHIFYKARQMGITPRRQWLQGRFMKDFQSNNFETSKNFAS